MILCAAAVTLGKILGQMFGDAVESPTAGVVLGTLCGVLPVFYFFPSRRFWWHAALSIVGMSLALLVTQDGLWAVFAVLAAGIVALLL
jgi:hypothetical protein